VNKYTVKYFVQVSCFPVSKYIPFLHLKIWFALNNLLSHPLSKLVPVSASVYQYCCLYTLSWGSHRRWGRYMLQICLLTRDLIILPGLVGPSVCGCVVNCISTMHHTQVLSTCVLRYTYNTHVVCMHNSCSRYSYWSVHTTLNVVCVRNSCPEYSYWSVHTLMLYVYTLISCLLYSKCTHNTCVFVYTLTSQHSYW